MSTAKEVGAAAGPLDKPVMVTDDVAEVMGVTSATVRWWLHTGRGPRSFKTPGGRRSYYLRDDVLAWLREARDAEPTAAAR